MSENDLIYSYATIPEGVGVEVDGFWKVTTYIFDNEYIKYLSSRRSRIVERINAKQSRCTEAEWVEASKGHPVYEVVPL